jgi:hypothetical protein
MKRYLLFIAIIIPLDIISQITPTNYALSSNWAAGKMKGPLDMTFSPDFTIVSEDTLTNTNVPVNYDTTSGYDIFCLYPTLLLGVNSNAVTQAINPTHKVAANLVLQWEMTAYSQFGRIYAPYYRQGNLATFFPTTSSAQQAGVLDTAITDVLAAFDYYMQNYNQGKKVILVGHSQGSMVLGMMLRQMEINPAYQPYLSKIFLSVLMGTETGPWTQQSSNTGGWWQNIPICQNISDTACIMTWGTHRYGTPLQTLVNFVPFNSQLVSKGYLYQNFDTAIHHIINDPLGFGPTQQKVNFSIYPKNLYQSIVGTNYNIATSFISFNNMYNGSTSIPDNTNYGFMVERIPGIPNDNRIDILDSISGNDLHTYDAYIGIGDVLCLIYQKMGRTCPYQYAIGINEENENSNPAAIFPNPFNNELNIKLLNSNQYEVKIHNTLGEIVYLTTIESGVQLNLENLIPGIYYLSLYNNNEHYNYKILNTP